VLEEARTGYVLAVVGNRRAFDGADAPVRIGGIHLGEDPATTARGRGEDRLAAWSLPPLVIKHLSPGGPRQPAHATESTDRARRHRRDADQPRT